MIKNLFLLACIYLSPFLPFSSQATYTALDLDEAQVVTLQRLASRSYDDTVYARSTNPDGTTVVQEATEDIDGVLWRKMPFEADNLTSAAGTVYFNGNQLVIAFHGSFWSQDWTLDFDLWEMRSASELFDGLDGNLHHGFSGRVIDTFDEMTRCINHFLGRDLHQEDIVYLTGHSLGGALSIVGGTKIAFKYGLPQNHVKIVTFSTPRSIIGDEDFVNHATRLLGKRNILSFCTISDVVSTELWDYPLKAIGNTFFPIGLRIDINPTEKTLSHYWTNMDALFNLDEIVPLRDFTFGVGFSGLSFLISGSTVTFALTLSAQATVEINKTMHAIPRDDLIRKAVKTTKDDVNRGKTLTDAASTPYFFSRRRNPILKWIVNTFTK